MYKPFFMKSFSENNEHRKDSATFYPLRPRKHRFVCLAGRGEIVYCINDNIR